MSESRSCQNVSRDELTDLEISEAQMDQLRRDLEAKVGDTIRAGSNIFQAIPDHMIGVRYTSVTLGEEPFERCLDWRFMKGSTDYTLDGELIYTVDAPTGSEPEPFDPNDIPVKTREPKRDSNHRVGR